MGEVGICFLQILRGRRIGGQQGADGQGNLRAKSRGQGHYRPLFIQEKVTVIWFRMKKGSSLPMILQVGCEQAPSRQERRSDHLPTFGQPSCLDPSPWEALGSSEQRGVTWSRFSDRNTVKLVQSWGSRERLDRQSGQLPASLGWG